MERYIRKMYVREYKALYNAFGIGHSCWDQLYLNFSPYVFCIDNRPSIIGQYLVLEDFVKRVKRDDPAFVYYWGIDKFLEVYKDAVYNNLKIQKESV